MKSQSENDEFVDTLPLRKTAARLVVALCMGLALGLAPLSGHAAAQYPAKLVKIVVPFSAGGFTDSLTRIVAQELTKKWGQPVVVDNRPGAGGNIGAEVAAKSLADGYTLFMTTISIHCINQALYSKIAFDAVKDFEPVILMVSTPNVLIVNLQVPFKTLPELIAAAKADADKFNYASTGIGTTPHLWAEQFKSLVGFKITHIPYKGSSQALTDLLSGRVQMMFDNLLFQFPYIKAGKVKPLAITSRTRSLLIPDVPTMMEMGVPGFEYGPWFGLVAPARTPSAIVAKINADVNAVLQMKEVQDKLQGAEILGGTPQQFSVVIAQDISKWGKMIRDLDLKVE